MVPAPTGMVTSGVAEAASTRAHSDAAEQRAWSLLKYALCAFLVWRVSLFVLEFFAVNMTPRMGKCQKHWEVFGKGHYFLNGFFRWDGGWYRSIAVDGYFIKPERPSNVAFFPLYPYLARVVGWVVGGPFVGALVVSNAALVGSIYFLRRLGDEWFGESVSRRAVVFLLVFPASFFFSACYTESLFLCLSAGAMTYYLRGRYLACGVLGFFAMLTRSTGVVLFLALAADAAWEVYRRREAFSPRMFWLLLIPSGLGVFMLVLDYQVDDPWAFARGMHYWGRQHVMPWTSIIDDIAKVDWTFKGPRFRNTQRLVDAASALGFIAIAVLLARRGVRVAFWMFVLLGVLFPLSTYVMASMTRYVLVLFPAFFALASYAERRITVERFVVFASGFLLCAYATRFFHCAWAG